MLRVQLASIITLCICSLSFSATYLQWTWSSGGSEAVFRLNFTTPPTENVPIPRCCAVGWYDSLNEEFWMFGGETDTTNATPSFLNDLGIYRVKDNAWTWVSGSNASNLPGSYSPINPEYPGARCCAVGWFDSENQEFWLFGGLGYAKSILQYGA